MLSPLVVGVEEVEVESFRQVLELDLPPLQLLLHQAWVEVQYRAEQEGLGSGFKGSYVGSHLTPCVGVAKMNLFSQGRSEPGSFDSFEEFLL